MIAAGCLLLMLAMCAVSCGRGDDKESNIAYGRVVDTDENTITVEKGNYKDGRGFSGAGGKCSYNLPESVFFDDFKKGDIVAILFDGDDATAVTTITAEAVTSGDGGWMTSGKNVRVEADNEEKSINGKDYDVDDTDTAGLMALGRDGRLDLTGVIVNVTGEGSLGIGAQDGGTVDAVQLSMTASGAESPCLGAFDAGSSMDISDSNLESTAEDSPCIYSAGNISLTGVTAVSTGVPAIDLTGGGIVNLKESNVTAYDAEAVDLCSGSVSERNTYQRRDTADMGSSSGSSASGSSQDKLRLRVNSSSIRTESEEPVFSVSGSEACVELIRSVVSSSSGRLADITGDGARSSKLLLYGMGQDLKGLITCDGMSSVKLVLREESSFKGAIDPKGAARYSKIYISDDSTWELTGDSYISSIVDEKHDCTNIDSNGYDIYYDEDRIANDWLGGRTIELKGGGVLTPAS